MSERSAKKRRTQTMATTLHGSKYNVEAIKSEIRRAIMNSKVNACPMLVRLAWHASGTYEKKSNSGGSHGATMRFQPESTDDANAGLGIARDLLRPVKKAHPEVSWSDLWTLAGVAAVEFSGGPKVPFAFGRTDAEQATANIPPNGRLPDAHLGQDHLRDVFYRMGFDDRGIVCLSGAHTLGRCHIARSGFDGPWTHHPLKFDNQYFKNLLERKWTPRQWDGEPQFTDESGKLMMLPTDMALVQDPAFKPIVEEYARDEQKFFDDFAKYFAQLISLGCPDQCCPGFQAPQTDAKEAASNEFREACMHGSLPDAKKLAPQSDVHAAEACSGRNALHKAAFWGHDQTVDFLVDDCKINVNVQDNDGDTALHDACRFGHTNVVKKLLAAGADKSLTNSAGQTAEEVAEHYEKPDIVSLLRA